MSRQNKIQMLPAEWRASSSLAGVYALRMLGMFLVLPVLALYAHSLPGVADADRLAMVGWAMAAYGLTQAVCQLPLGMASDRFGRKKVIYFGLLLFAAGSFAAALAESVQMLVAARAIQGAGAVSAAVTALVADLTREEVRTRAMSMIGLSIGLTFSFSLVLSPVLSKVMGVSGLFVLMGVLTLLSIAVVAKYTPDEPRQIRLHQDTQAQASRIGEVLKNTQLVRLNFGIFALQTGLMAIFTTLPFSLQALGWDKTQHWQVYLPATVIGLVLMVPAIIVGETRNKLKPVFVAGIALILIAQAALIGSLSSLLLIGLCLIVYFVGFNILEASMPSLVSKIAPSDLKGTAMGVYNTLQSVGLFIGGIVGSRLYEHYGQSGVLLFCCVLMLVWLAVAVSAPAPKPVKNVILGIPAAWQANLSSLKLRIEAVEGVEAVSFSADRQTVFIKALQKGFDENTVKSILSGV